MLTGLLLLAALRARATAAPPSPPPPPPPAGPTVGSIVYLPTGNGAVCLDGSPAALYVAPNAETRKVLLFQEGGGWCGPGENCRERALTPLGSSATYPPTMGLSGGYLSADAAENPLLWNWTKVILMYCDGSSQTGDLDSPVRVGNQTIFYRGHRILLAAQAYLSATALAGATDVIVAGCSAGGLSAFLHADEWAAALPSARVTALPDSGFFLDYNSTKNGGYGGLMRLVAGAMNSTLPAACVAANPGDPAACIFAETVSRTLATPTFALQGKYDSWQLVGDAGIPQNDTVGVNEWGAMLSARIGATLLAQPRHGAFLDSCLHHCGGFDSFKVDSFTQATAHAAWYARGARALYNQSETYPCAACCG